MNSRRPFWVCRTSSLGSRAPPATRSSRRRRAVVGCCRVNASLPSTTSSKPAFCHVLLSFCLAVTGQSYKFMLLFAVVMRCAGSVGLGGSNDPLEIYLGVKHGILTPHIFWYTPTCCHWGYIIITLYSETRSGSVFFLSFITDLWTPRNVALMILTPPTCQSENSSCTPGHGCCEVYDLDRKWWSRRLNSMLLLTFINAVLFTCWNTFDFFCIILWLYCW